MPSQSQSASHQTVKGGAKNTTSGKTPATPNPATDINASAVKQNLVHHQPDGPACDSQGGTTDYQKVIHEQLALKPATDGTCGDTTDHKILQEVARAAGAEKPRLITTADVWAFAFAVLVSKHPELLTANSRLGSILICTTAITNIDPTAPTPTKTDKLYVVHHRSTTSLQSDIGLTDAQIGQLLIIKSSSPGLEEVIIHTRREMEDLIQEACFMTDTKDVDEPAKDANTRVVSKSSAVQRMVLIQMIAAMVSLACDLPVNDMLGLFNAPKAEFLWPLILSATKRKGQQRR